MPNISYPDITGNSAIAEKFLGHIQKSFSRRQMSNAGPCAVELEHKLAMYRKDGNCLVFANFFTGLFLTMRYMAKTAANGVFIPFPWGKTMEKAAAMAGLKPLLPPIGKNGDFIYNEDPDWPDETGLVVCPRPAPALSEKYEKRAAESGISILYYSAGCIGRESGVPMASVASEICNMGEVDPVNAWAGSYLLTKDGELAARLAKARAFGFAGWDNIEYAGLNAKLNELHAAMALASLDTLHARTLAARALWQSFAEKLEAVSHARLLSEPDENPRSSVIVRLDSGSAVKMARLLQSENVAAYPAQMAVPGLFGLEDAQKSLVLPFFLDPVDIERTLTLLTKVTSQNRAKDCNGEKR